jgi:GNAT superfamily N-acetyltransferase
MNITYQVEKYSDVREEVSPLGEANFLEGDARNKHTSINIDWDMYSELEDRGSAILITARDNEILVGYLSLCLSTHPHVKDKVQATSDAIYIEPEVRNSGIGGGLLAAAEEALRGAGVFWLSLSFRKESIAKPLMDRLGYEQTDVVFGKNLGDK